MLWLTDEFLIVEIKNMNKNYLEFSTAFASESVFPLNTIQPTHLKWSRSCINQ